MAALNRASRPQDFAWPFLPRGLFTITLDGLSERLLKVYMLLIFCLKCSCVTIVCFQFYQHDLPFIRDNFLGITVANENSATVIVFFSANGTDKARLHGRNVDPSGRNVELRNVRHSRSLQASAYCHPLNAFPPDILRLKCFQQILLLSIVEISDPNFFPSFNDIKSAVFNYFKFP